MPNQELSNYVSQARVAGKTNEAIKQELLNAGWQEADISEALGAGTAPISMPAVATVAAASGMSAKVISIIVVALLVAGGVAAYFAFFNKKTPKNQTSNNSSYAATITQTENTSNGAPFHCIDLFPEDSDLVVKFDEKFITYDTVYPDGSLRYKAWNLGCTDQSLDFQILVVFSDEPNRVDNTFETALKGHNGQSPVPIQGIGSRAAKWNNINSVDVESSNRKYFFSVS